MTSQLSIKMGSFVLIATTMFGSLLCTPAEAKVGPKLQRRINFAPTSSFNINYAEYARYCEGNGEPKHPCFTHWAGSLGDVQFSGPVGDVLVKDGAMTDFTMREPHSYFTMTYPNMGGVSLSYGNYDASTGCYDVGLQSKGNRWRIWVSDENGNDRDLDTKHYTNTGQHQFCTKWLHIHVAMDG